MILYHFTAQRFVKKILKEGLTKGWLVKSLSPPKLDSGWQWLTKNDHFNQAWARGTGRLPYKRNEVRLTFNIPDFAKENVIPWTKMRFVVPEVYEDMSRYGDPENWMLYEGVVPSDWIVSVDENTEGIEATL